MSLYDDVYGAFVAADVRFVVGGMAVVLSGHVRATVDLDVVVDLAPEPARRAMTALTELGLRPRVPVAPLDFADPAVRQGWIETKNMQVLSFYDPQHVAREVDVFVAYPIDFERLVAVAVPTQVAKRTVPVASISDLLEMKRAAGRPQDLADIEALERLGIEDRVPDDPWAAATFAGASAAQAGVAANLTPTQRVALLEELLQLAIASGSLQRARRAKQAEIDEVWATG